MHAPRFWYGNNPSASILGALISPLGALYRLGTKIKNSRIAPYRTRAKVVCVGNLTLGGTGKTPVAIAVAERLRARGLNVFILSRGYGGRMEGPVVVDPERHGASEVGDEPLLLAKAATTIVARDRAAGARLADEQGADVIVMDDGHQNLSLTKDFSLVVVDAEAGFGNGRVFPAGPLRETIKEGLERADAVVLVGKGAPDLGGFAGAVLAADFAPDEPEALAEKKVVAFAGIGRPEKFFAMLSENGARVVAARGYDDHHVYSAADLRALRALATRFAADLVTTVKDFVRLPHEERSRITPVAIRARFQDDGALDRVLDKLGSNPATPSP
jgi:tetraacyldisaccharide 4'-kinase